MKVLKIKSTRMDFFVKYLLVLNEILKLRKSALYVLARLLYWNDKFKDIEEDERNLIVFNAATRAKILQSLEMSRASLDNQFTYLRKRGIIQNNKINPIYKIYYDTHKDLMFSFIIEEDE